MARLARKVIHVFPGLRRGGGPAGYAYNLSKALQMVADVGAGNTVEILAPTQDILTEVKPPSHPSWKFALLKRMPAWLGGPILAARTASFRWNALVYFGFSRSDVEKMKTAGVVVFHDFRLASAYLHGVPEGQKVYIMPHTPTDHASELVENWRIELGETKVWSFIHHQLMRMELGTYLMSNGLLVPCRRALDGYFANLQGAGEMLRRLPIHELKSGVDSLKVSRDRDEVLAQLGVPPGRKVVGFFGRRHPHKGYDVFCKAAVLAHERGYKNIVFVAAGAGPLPSPEGLPNFKDLGFLTDNLGDLVAAVDLIVVPNRVSYFDLFILEALSLGKPILTTGVGGNSCIDAPGIFFLEVLSSEFLLEEALRLLSSPAMLEQAGRANRDYYLNRYTLEAFGRRHLEFAQKVLGLYWA